MCDTSGLTCAHVNFVMNTCQQLTCVNVSSWHVLMSAVDMCWCQQLTCVNVSSWHVLMSAVDMCWCQQLTCVDVSSHDIRASSTPLEVLLARHLNSPPPFISIPVTPFVTPPLALVLTAKVQQPLFTPYLEHTDIESEEDSLQLFKPIK